MDLSSIRLTRDQVELLVTLVDAFRRAPKKEPFWLLRHGRGDDLIHPGLQDDFEVYFGDLEALRDAGILRLSRIRQSSRQYDISPLGFDYYDHVLSERGEDISSNELPTVSLPSKPNRAVKVLICPRPSPLTTDLSMANCPCAPCIPAITSSRLKNLSLLR